MGADQLGVHGRGEDFGLTLRWEPLEDLEERRDAIRCDVI